MLDKVQLRSIANESPTSQAVFDLLASRQRFRDKTNLVKLKYDLIHRGKKVVDNEYFGTFKKLHELGVGSLIVGRRGKPNRFIWNFNLKDIGQAAFSETDEEPRVLGIKKTYGPRRKMRARKKIVEQVPTQEHREQLETQSKGYFQLMVPIPLDFRPKDLTALLELIKDLTK